MSSPVHVIGAGLAGSECAWQLARRGVPVVLHEMRPGRGTPAHKSGDFAELVCSNSLRSDDPHHAAGPLKREMEELGSLTFKATAAPADGSPPRSAAGAGPRVLHPLGRPVQSGCQWKVRREAR